jgi:hypothetical protein
VVDTLNAAAETYGFSCRGAEYLTMSSPDGGSFSGSFAVNEARESVQVLTLDGVSYARVEPGTDPIPSPRREVVEKVGKNWGSWGQPDTVLLEMTPASPSSCLGWEGIYAATATGVQTSPNGTITFTLALANPGPPHLADEPITASPDALVIAGVYTPAAERSPATFEFQDNDRPIVAVLTGSSTLVLPVIEKDMVVNLTQDEYMLLVGASSE